METVELIKTVAPEIIEIIEKRYLILSSISQNQPIGRRALAQELGFRERNVREEVGILKEEGLINIDSKGMYIEEKGISILDRLHDLYADLKGLPQLEEKLQSLLKIKKIVIVTGDSSENKLVLREMAKASFKLLKETIEDRDIIGITGGNTMASLVEEALVSKEKRDVIVIPARGGLGKNLNTQSNSIAAKLAEGLGGTYRLLYIPDGLEEEALEYMLKNEEISQSIDLINNMNTLVFFVCRADTMAERRNLAPDKIDDLLEKGAVAEAFGHYFNLKGEEVWEYKTIGLSLEKFKTLDNLIGVAGGREKAKAMISVASLNKDMILVTDESAAREIVNIVHKL